MTDRNDIDTDAYAGWIGRKAVDPDGDKLGTIDELYADDRTGEPEWVTVKTGLFGSRSTFVPLAGATTSESGDDLVLPYDKGQVKDAPNIDADGTLTEEEERELYRHYGREADYDREREQRRQADEQRAEATRSGDAGPATGDARQGELVGEGRGGVRLRKYLVTEERTITVPVTREEVRVEREPFDEPDPGEGGGQAR